VTEEIAPQDLVRDGYDHVADEYFSTRSETPESSALFQEFIGRLPPGASVLDAGCGAGTPIARMLSKSFDVTGVDISQEQINRARQLVPEATFLCQDMVDLTFPDSPFDGICSYYAIIHIPREEHPALLRSFHAMLKPGGFVLLCMGAGDLPGSVNEDWLGAPMYWSHYGAETNLKMIQECGFTVLSSELVSDNFTKPPATHLFVLAEKR
jgi:cyclopropane fatty-acyl-phospholipid synthase-like methyltransferase